MEYNIKKLIVIGYLIFLIICVIALLIAVISQIVKLFIFIRCKLDKNYCHRYMYKKNHDAMKKNLEYYYSDNPKYDNLKYTNFVYQQYEPWRNPKQ